ncbi:MAG: M3 family peptidase [Bradyrhizobium sp.]|nr:MAG: M3 family peptidase [Bradyrhizobium sp.]
MAQSSGLGENPLLESWDAPFGAAPFASIHPEHFRPAFDAALAERRREVAAIASEPAPASFDNTIAALERAGATLDRVSAVFFHLASADTNDELQRIEREIAPILSRERSALLLDDALFQRIEALQRAVETLGLDAEQKRAFERWRTAFLRAGAGLAPEKKARLAAIGERLASLGAAFGQNVLADEKAFALVLDGSDDLAGLPESLVTAAAEAAVARGLAGKHVATLSRSSYEPFMQSSARRDLREAMFRAFVARGAGGGDHDNAAIMRETVQLRDERAHLLGYASFADYRLADSMAKTPAAALGLLDRVWAPARAEALHEAEALQAMIAAEGGNFDLKPWDWRYYAEKRRKALYDIDAAELAPYLPLESMIAAAFEVAHRLFGLSFVARDDIPLPHADARAWEARGPDGAPIALFIGDYFARPSKRSGAWMSALRDQQRFDGPVLPIVVNVMSFARASEAQPCLLSLDEAHTLFHEFGHGLHGMLSDVTYPLLSGTHVSRDFVEFPSQLYEHWLERPEILRAFARHHATGAPMPEALIARLAEARRFNQGFATVEFVASALVDLQLHRRAGPGAIDVADFEAQTLAAIGMPAAIAPRHAAAHFQHVFSGDGYASAYYSYLWSEILDADGFEAFEAAGDDFAPALAERLKRFVYAAGNLREPEAAYRAFRGRDPSPDALLRKRGLVES